MRTPSAAGALIVRGEDLVVVSEALYRRLFAVGAVLGVLLGLFAVALAPTGPPPRHVALTVGLGVATTLAWLAAWWWRDQVYAALRARPLLVPLAGAAFASLEIVDDAHRSALYWPILAVLGIAAIVGGGRLTALTVGAVLGVDLLGGVFTSPRLEGGEDVEAMLFARGGLVLWGIVLAFMTARLARLPATVNQALRGSSPRPRRAPPRRVQASARAPDAAARPVSAALPPAAPGVERLTARQLEVVALLCDGLRGAEIADRLGVSPRTVERHIREARRRAGIVSTTALVAQAIEAGLVPAPPA